MLPLARRQVTGTQRRTFRSMEFNHQLVIARLRIQNGVDRSDESLFQPPGESKCFSEFY